MSALANSFNSGLCVCVVISLGIAAGLANGHLSTMRWIGLSASIFFGPITGIALSLHDCEFTSAAIWALSMIAPIALLLAFFRGGGRLFLLGGFATWIMIGLVLTISSAI